MSWGNDGAIYQEKMDGKFATMDWRGDLLAGERMADGRFVAWDVLSIHGEDIRMKPAIERLTALRCINDILWSDGYNVVRWSFNGGDLLRTVLAAGGEGVVRKESSASYYDAMQACKRSSIFVCRVTSIGPGQSVAIVDSITGQDRGRVALRGGKCDQIRVGSVIRVEAMNETAMGKLRQPAVCRDWLVTR